MKEEFAKLKTEIGELKELTNKLKLGSVGQLYAKLMTVSYK